VNVHERLPSTSVIEEKWFTQHVLLGEVAILCCSVAKAAIRVAGKFVGQG
jgi:hypothetical protein